MERGLKKCICILLSAIMMIVAVPEPVEALIPSVTTWFTGEKATEEWTTAITIDAPDTALLSPDYMVELEWDGTAAPSLVLSSWSGGKAWAQVAPCENIDGKLYYGYSDMIASFGEDLSLVDALHVMACAAGGTVYSLSAVRAEDVLNEKKQETSERRVVGYLPDWSYEVYKTMDMSCLTHINIAFCNPDESGVLSCNIPDSELRSIVGAAHKNGVKVLASMGGAGTVKNYPELTATDEARASFNQNIMDYCEEFELDGVDLDIEGEVAGSFWDTYEAWCCSLREECDKNKLLLTTATACWLSNKATNKALQSFDFINVMAYDDDGDASTHSGYDFAEYSLNYFRVQRGIPSNRLVLGVPFYGRGYNADGTLSWESYVPFSELVAKDKENYNRDLCDGIAYNGAETMKKKCELASHFGGIMIWELSQDAGGELSLLAVIGDEILKQRTTVGDVNLDGKIDASDVKLMLNGMLGEAELDAPQSVQGDINGDGVVNVLDMCGMKEIVLYGKAS